MKEIIGDKCLRGVYANYISLGYNCHIGKDLEELCLRNASGPYDWCFTKWKCIERGLKGDLDFMRYGKLAQIAKNPHMYNNRDYEITFVHDFNKYEPLIFQYRKVREKYDRRTRRFLESVKSPTLFLRYCANENELRYIEENFDAVYELVRSHNRENDIVFITDRQGSCDIPTLYFIERDADEETSSRKPIRANAELCAMLQNARFEGREKNRQFEEKKKAAKRKKISLPGRVLKRFGIIYRHYRRQK